MRWTWSAKHNDNLKTQLQKVKHNIKSQNTITIEKHNRKNKKHDHKK